jgi:predicted HTH domain antitoxin
MAETAENGNWKNRFVWQCPTMTLTLPLPAALEKKMQPRDAKLHLAIGAFTAEEVTLGQAAEIAGVSQTEMMKELARRKIPQHYDVDDFEQDLKTVAALS